MLKLYGSGVLNQHDVSFIREFFNQWEKVGFIIDSSAIDFTETKEKEGQQSDLKTAKAIVPVNFDLDFGIKKVSSEQQ